MIIIIILVIWFILSLFAIHYLDSNYDSRNLLKIHITACAIALLFNGWQVYDPELSRMIVTIEMNPTWTSALILAFVEGTCITGPIAGLKILKEKMKERRG